MTSSNAEQQKADEGAGRRDVEKRQRHQHAEHFVDDDGAGILAELLLDDDPRPRCRRQRRSSSASPSTTALSIQRTAA